MGYPLLKFFSSMYNVDVSPIMLIVATRSTNAHGSKFIRGTLTLTYYDSLIISRDPRLAICNKVDLLLSSYLCHVTIYFCYYTYHLRIGSRILVLLDTHIKQDTCIFRVLFRFYQIASIFWCLSTSLPCWIYYVLFRFCKHTVYILDSVTKL